MQSSCNACLPQVPDFTLELTDEADGQSFIAATGAQLPPGAIKTAADKKGPVGKVFLFSTKYEVPGIYKALAMHFHGKSRLLFGWTTPDAKGPGYPLMQKMNVSDAPRPDHSTAKAQGGCTSACYLLVQPQEQISSAVLGTLRQHLPCSSSITGSAESHGSFWR